MTSSFKLEKSVWTESDFETMGWHDVRIHSFAFYPEEYELAIDMDYIFQWVNPKEGELYYKFWISPVTMVFENVYDVGFDLETSAGFEIDGINKSNPKTPKNVKYIKKDTEWLFEIECQEGVISLISIGYKMYVKRHPSLVSSQSLSLKGTSKNPLSDMTKPHQHPCQRGFTEIRS